MTKASPQRYLCLARVLCEERRAKNGERGVQRPKREAVHLARKRLQLMDGLQVTELLLDHEGLALFIQSGGRFS